MTDQPHAGLPPGHRILRPRRFLEDTIRQRSRRDAEHDAAIDQFVDALRRHAAQEPSSTARRQKENPES